MQQRVIASAIIRNCKVVATDIGRVRVMETPLVVNHSILARQAYYKGIDLVGWTVDIRVRFVVLDEGTRDERWMWTADIIGAPR